MKDTHKFQVSADYHQFYLMDASIEPNIPEEVTEQDILRRLRTAPHIVVFQTESAAHVHLEVVFLSEPTEAEVHGSTKPRSVFRSRRERRLSAVVRISFPIAPA